MHPIEKFIHQAKHASERAAPGVHPVAQGEKEMVDAQTEKRAKKARMTLLQAIAERPRLENLLERSGADLVLRRGRITLKQSGADFPDVHLPMTSDGSDDAERARLARL